ncbi:MAG: RNA 2',3'-cyclic phosphodiesterase [Caldilinea sp.]
MRAFIAIEMPPPALRRVAAIQRHLAHHLRSQQLDRCVRWTSAANLHLTLRFLGEINQLQCDTLLTMLSPLAAQHPTLSLYNEGLGCFPNAVRPSVIWCGLQGDLRTLMQLQVDIEKTVRSVGIAPDARQFKPHLTIGRTQRSATTNQLRAVGAIVMQSAALRYPGPTDDLAMIGELILFQSELTPSGPIYTRLGVFRLADK